MDGMNLFPLIKQHPILCSILAILLTVSAASALWGKFRPLPKGLSAGSDWMSANEIRFLTDMTYRESEMGNRIVEQEIFEEIYRLIAEADHFLIVDMFLFNDEYNRSYRYPALSAELVNQLIRRKSESPEMDIQVITDPINTFYGAYPSENLNKLKAAGISVTYTKLEKLRHSNPLFSTFYAPFLSHFGTRGKGWIPNPFSPDSPKVTLSAILKMLNFRANHRKVALSEKEAIISSANPHDASGYHSNIALSVKGPILQEIAKGEQAVIRFSSNPSYTVDFGAIEDSESMKTDPVEVRWLTEGKIREQWLEILQKAGKDDRIAIAMFYLSDRKIVEALKQAASRGAEIRMILDANKDAFGREKNGIPNRQVTHELMKLDLPNLNIRWYHTSGEQFHSKLMTAEINSQNAFYLVAGSANLTKRNIGNYNLEANLAVRTELESPLQKELSSYFDKMWSNKKGYFTENYAAYADDSWFKTFIYRLQDFTGACTF